MHYIQSVDMFPHTARTEAVVIDQEKPRLLRNEMTTGKYLKRLLVTE